jgi:hypothetical protein
MLVVMNCIISFINLALIPNKNNDEDHK